MSGARTQHLLIAVSQYVLRRQTPGDKLTVKMWFFPYLTIVAALGIVGVLLQMFLTDAARSQLVLSRLSWGVVLALYAVTRWRGGSMSAEEVEERKARTSGRAAERILVLANQTLVGEQLHDALLDIEGRDRAEYATLSTHVVISTHSEERSTWLRHGVVDEARKRYDDINIEPWSSSRCRRPDGTPSGTWPEDRPSA